MRPMPAEIRPDHTYAFPHQYPVIGGLGNLQHVRQASGLTKLEIGALLLAPNILWSEEDPDIIAARAVELAGAVLDACAREEGPGKGERKD